jgi:hypothetical protein
MALTTGSSSTVRPAACRVSPETLRFIKFKAQPKMGLAQKIQIQNTDQDQTANFIKDFCHPYNSKQRNNLSVISKRPPKTARWTTPTWPVKPYVVRKRRNR